MNKKYGPIYARGRVRAKTYSAQERDNLTANVWGVLYVNENMSEKTAYDVVKTLFEKQSDLVLAHRESENMTLENQTIGASPVAWHPGAIKFFKEKGITRWFHAALRGGSVRGIYGSRAVLLFCCPAWASAQTAAPDLARAEALVREGKAAESYALLAPFEFQYSGNADFDYWFGVSALEAGHADKATLALERALIVNPDFLAARLDLARAYFALGDRERARAEFNLVLAQEPPPAARATIDRYLTEIERSSVSARTRWSAYLELSVGYDSNVNNSTGQSTIFVPLFGLDLTLTPTSVRKPDSYILFGGGAELAHALTEKWSAFAGVDYKQRLNRREGEFDYAQLDGRVGLQYQTKTDLYRAAISGGEYFLDYRRHYENAGASLEWRHALDDRNVTSVFGVYNQLRFADAALKGNNVNQAIGGAGWLHAFNPERNNFVFVTAYAGHEFDTENRVDGERRLWGMRVVRQYNLHPAVDVYGIVGAHLSDYDTENFVFQATRKDRLYEAAVGAIWHFDRNWTVRPQVSYTRAHSNIPIYAYNRYDISVVLRRDFR